MTDGIWGGETPPASPIWKNQMGEESPTLRQVTGHRSTLHAMYGEFLGKGKPPPASPIWKNQMGEESPTLRQVQGISRSS